MANDPRTIIGKSPMSGFQLIAIAVTVGLNALDGFDVGRRVAIDGKEHVAVCEVT